MVEQETNLESFPPSKMTIEMKNKLKRSRSTMSPSSTKGMQNDDEQQLKRMYSSRRVIGRRVETLKELIPNSHECIGVDGLFRETADYILTLRLKVQVMQTVIDLLSRSGNNNY